jgi:hypothetical protein
VAPLLCLFAGCGAAVLSPAVSALPLLLLRWHTTPPPTPHLQVFTACCNSFAHGSNDVANAMGPVSGIYTVWRCTCVASKADVPIWILVIGGLGIVLGECCPAGSAVTQRRLWPCPPQLGVYL